MRPPKEKWRLTAEAVEALFKLILTIDGSVNAKAVGEARQKVDELKQHVNESEECES